MYSQPKKSLIMIFVANVIFPGGRVCDEPFGSADAAQQLHQIFPVWKLAYSYSEMLIEIIFICLIPC